MINHRIDGYYYVADHYDIDGEWVTLEELEGLLIEAPYGYKNDISYRN